MSQLVTRCPHCSTSFHVSEPQLRAARGAVRCGSCLQVFRADENIVFNEDDPQPANKKAIEELLEDDDFLIHDDIDLDGDDQAAKEDLPKSAKAAPKQPAQAPTADKKSDDSPLIDDAFGEQQWQELGSEEDDDRQGDLLDLNSDLDRIGDTSDNPWAEEMAREESSNTRHGSATQSADDLFAEQFEATDGTGTPNHDELLASPTEDYAQTDEFALHSDDQPGSLPDARLDPSELNARHLDSGQLESAPLLPKDQLISSIGAAPIEMSWQPKRHHIIPTWLWALGSLLLMLGLAAQTAYFGFDTLSKREPWRNLYAQVCPYIGCTLPPQVDINAIHTANLVVRSHPTIPGALAVEAVLLNRAPFDQPFPSLQLRFTDLKNSPVASRHFSPRDYLRGELSGRRLMPAGNPVHIALDIVDPGADAVNYELRIAPN
ncbi:DUF3426 domain-containing protein [Microbulbifer agarilyticus]|uniref:DUF3426 domain-containing protein n=1 Tax=Microbulbifer agarilyticus TaxID=260552 RepID=UPI001C961104|nr:DUF3426 domain-containing protein [Microbulbifer agarilyticus]MBY6211865.1 DUF3426 domain-containing protein [Microbulbifer agarilyticus]MCA0893110.1 DUF3426 domain-containing protein [Microbulbifer agarilyticus]